MKTIDWQSWLLFLIAIGILVFGIFAYLNMPTVMVSHETGENLGCLVDKFLGPNDPECQKIFKSGHFETEIWP